MSLLSNVLQEPLPAFAFEVSEAGIATARISGGERQIGFRALEPGTVSVSPVRDNVQRPEILKNEVAALVPPTGGRRKRRAVLIVPDYAARIAVLDFDSFPSKAEEQLALVRFRMKKSIPFDIESAVVSYYAQPKNGEARKVEVVAAVIAVEIVDRYEAPFREASLQTGLVIPSGLAALNLVKPEGVTLAAKLSGRTLSVFVSSGPVLKLARCVELDSSSVEDVTSVLHPTLAYIEDELKTQPARILLCGFGALADGAAPQWQQDWGVPVERLGSRFGTLNEANAGLLGYLESVQS